MSETETLDKLYLEWSQFTNARTSRELKLFELLKIAEVAIRTKHSLPDNWKDNYNAIYSEMYRIKTK